jgi:hypothetical protein
MGYCIEYDLEAMAGSIIVAWPKLVSLCNEYLDMCLEAGLNELRLNDDIDGYFRESHKKLVRSQQLDWGMRLEGYKLGA